MEILKTSIDGVVESNLFELCLARRRKTISQIPADKNNQLSIISHQSSISHQFEKAILSEKDLKHACLKDAVLDFDINDIFYRQ